ncbi:hypothetical protein SMICM304S_02682 [Streptomyces microflavus]
MTTARTVRGIRFVAAACPRVSSAPPSAAWMSAQGTSREPKATDATMTAASARRAARSQSVRTPAGRRATVASGGRRSVEAVT